MATTDNDKQVERDKLLAEAMKQPGVAIAAETYGRIAQNVPDTPQLLTAGGYAVGGNCC